MKQYVPETIRDFKKSGDSLKQTHINGAMNFSVAIMYSNVDSFINAFSLSMKSFDPEMNVSTTVTSF